MLPVAVTALAMGAAKLRNITTPEPIALDVLSLMLSAIGFGALVYGLSSIGEAVSGHTPVAPWLPILVGLARALAAVAQAIATTGDTDRAETVARSITNPFGQARALAAVAQAIATTGDTDRAETVARSITDPFQQAQALAAVAAAIATTGDTDRAEAMARSITNPFGQAQALAAVAEAIATTSDAGQTGRFIAQVLAVMPWQTPLPVLAKHQPRVVLACVDELSGNERSRYTEQP